MEKYFLIISQRRQFVDRKVLRDTGRNKIITPGNHRPVINIRKISGERGACLLQSLLIRIIWGVITLRKNLTIKMICPKHMPVDIKGQIVRSKISFKLFEGGTFSESILCGSKKL